MEYIVDDKKLDAFTFIAFVKQVWQGNYDIEKTQCALSQTINITAYSLGTVYCRKRLSSDLQCPVYFYFQRHPLLWFDKNDWHNTEAN